MITPEDAILERVEPNPFLGVHDASDAPNAFAADEFVPLTYWGGSVDGRSIGVFSGYRPNDPNSGTVVVLDDTRTFAARSMTCPQDLRG